VDIRAGDDDLISLMTTLRSFYTSKQVQYSMGYVYKSLYEKEKLSFNKISIKKEKIGLLFTMQVLLSWDNFFFELHA